MSIAICALYIMHNRSDIYVRYFVYYYVLYMCVIFAIINTTKTKAHRKAGTRKGVFNMKNYKITDKTTKAIIGVVAMTPDQARRAEKDFIVKEA